MEKATHKETNFEKIAATPQTLGEFLRGLPILEGPWDDEFHRAFCAGCPAENCDAENCPHEAQRNNPEWWLSLKVKEGE